jgi:ankyrin repeat protein
VINSNIYVHIIVSFILTFVIINVTISAQAYGHDKHDYSLHVMACTHSTDDYLISHYANDPTGLEVRLGQDRYTPLHLAVLGGHVENVEGLLEAWADPDIKDSDGDTPLILASTYPHRNIEIVDLLIEYGADVNAQNDQGDTALLWSVLDDPHPVIAEALVEAGADINAQNELGWAPIMFAHRAEDIKFLEFMIQSGADLSLKDESGWTPLFWAVSDSDSYMIGAANIFLKYGADPNIQVTGPDYTKDYSPLMLAAHIRDGALVKILLEAGADVSLKESKGRTVEDFIQEGIESDKELMKQVENLKVKTEQ